MIRWTPPTQNSPPAPQGWRPRADISKSNVALSSDDPELAILRSQLLAMRREVREIQEALTAMRLERERLVFNRAFAALRFKAAAIRFEELRRKGGFNQDQPRVPAGSPDGGQWTSGEASSAVRQPATYLLAAIGKQSAAYCWNQMLIDFLLCDSLQPRSLIGACRSQAMERYAACLQGKPIPPLPF